MKNLKCIKGFVFLTILFLFFLIQSITAYDSRNNASYDSASNVFWFIQISDTHIGKEDGSKLKDDENLRWLLNSGVPVVNPKIVINTGDLTDATHGDDFWLDPWHGLKIQEKDEWLLYKQVTENQSKSFYFDVPGNHDRYGDSTWSGLYDPVDNTWFGYATCSVQGPGSNPVGEFSTTVTLPNGDSYLFIGINTNDSTGLPYSPAWFVSDYPELSEVERKYIDSTLTNFYSLSSNPKLSFLFGHASIYRLTGWTPNLMDEWYLNEVAKRGAGPLVSLMNQYNVSAYLFGHTHKSKDLYDLNSQHNISSRLINTSSLTEQDTYRIVAVDNDGVSTRAFNKNKWPQVLITSPLNVYMNGLNNAYNQQTINDPFAYTLKSDSTNFVRALAFFSPLQTRGNKVEFRARKKSILPWIGGWNQMVNVSGNIYQANWDCYFLDDGEYELEVEASSEDVISLDYPSEDTHKISVKIDNSNCAFTYPNCGENLKGTFQLKATIDEKLLDWSLTSGIKAARFYYSFDRIDWVMVPFSTIMHFETKEIIFPFDSKWITSKKVWFKVEIEVRDGIIMTKTFSDESDEPVTIDNVLPTAPVLSAKPVKDGCIELNWTSSTDDYLAGYKIYRMAGGETAYSLQYDGIIGNSFTDSFTENGKTYFYKIKAYDLAGNESEFSNPAFTTSDNNSPNVVLNFATYSSKNKLKLTWQNPTDLDYSKTVIFHSETDSENLSCESIIAKSDAVEIYTGDGTSCTDFPLTDGARYFYFAFGIDQSGNISTGVKTSGIPGRTPADYVFLIQTGKPWFDPFVLSEYKNEAARGLEFLDADKAEGDKVSLVYFSNGGIGTKSAGGTTKHIYNTLNEFWNNVSGTARGSLSRLSALETRATNITNTDCGSCHTIDKENHPVSGWTADTPGCNGNGLCHSNAQNCISTGLSQVDKIFQNGANTDKRLVLFTNWYMFPFGFSGGGKEPRYLSFWLEQAFKNKGYKVTGIDFNSYSENDYYQSRLSYYWNASNLKNVFNNPDWNQYLKTEKDRLTDNEWRNILNRNWNQVVAMNSPYIKKGERYVQSIPVTWNDGELKIIVRNDNGLTNKLYYPDSKIVDFETDPNVIYEKQNIYDVYRIAGRPSAKSGSWQVVCDGTNITRDSTKVEVEAMTGAGTELIADVPEDSVVGGRIKIKALVNKGDSTDSVEKIDFKIEGTDKYVSLYDDGAHGDGTAGDGYYANTFMIGTTEGKYNWKIKFTGKDKDGFKIVREEIGEINITGQSPMVTYLSPVGLARLGGTIVEESPQIEFNVNDDGSVDSVAVKVDGVVIQNSKTKIQDSGVPISSGQNYIAWIDSVLSSGEHVVEITAWDNAHHQSAPEAKKFTLASKIADIIDLSAVADSTGDANGGNQIAQYPSGLNQNELDIKNLRLYIAPRGVEVTVAKELTGNEIYDLGFSVEMASLPASLEEFRGVLHIYLNVGTPRSNIGMPDLLPGVNAKLANGDTPATTGKWDYVAVINCKESYLLDYQGNKTLIIPTFNKTTNTISFMLSDFSLLPSSFSLCCMSFGYNEYAENNLMPITMMGGENQFAGFAASRIVDLLWESSREDEILRANLVEVPLISILMPGYIDTIAPEIAEISPEGYIFDRRPEIRAKVIDNNILQIVNCKLQNANLEEIALAGGFDKIAGIMNNKPVNDLEYGEYKAEITANDAAGNISIKDWTFYLREIINDTTLPLAEITLPAEGSFVYDTVQIIGTIQDDNLESYKMEICRGESMCSPIFETAGSFDSSELSINYQLSTVNFPDGVYDLKMIVTDKMFNEMITGVKINIDNTMPNVELVLPSTAGIGENVEITGSIFDKNISNYQLKIVNAQLQEIILKEGSESICNVVLANWNTNGLTAGDYKIKITVNDKAGNVIDKESVITLVNKPIVKLISPADGNYLKGIVSITGAVKSETNPNITWKLKTNNGSADNIIAEGIGEINGELCQWDTREFVDGVWNMKLTVGATLAVAQITVDNTPPAVNITSPLDSSLQGGQATVAGMVDIIGTAYDEHLSNYEIIVGAVCEPLSVTNWQSLPTFSPNKITNGKIGEWDLREFKIENSTFKIRLTAKDAAGNVSEKEITLNAEEDTTVPVAKITSPADNSHYYLNDTIPIYGTVSDNHLENYKLIWRNEENGKAGELSIVNAQLSIINGEMGEWNLTGLPEGNYTLRLEAKDTSGNASNCEIKNIYIGNGLVRLSKPVLNGILKGQEGIYGYVDTANVRYYKLSCYRSEMDPYGQTIYQHKLVNSGTYPGYDSNGLYAYISLRPEDTAMVLDYYYRPGLNTDTSGTDARFLGWWDTNDSSIAMSGYSDGKWIIELVGYETTGEQYSYNLKEVGRDQISVTLNNNGPRVSLSYPCFHYNYWKVGDTVEVYGRIEVQGVELEGNTNISWRLEADDLSDTTDTSLIIQSGTGEIDGLISKWMPEKSADYKLALYCDYANGIKESSVDLRIFEIGKFPETEIVSPGEGCYATDNVLEIKAKLSDEPNYNSLLKWPHENVKWELSCDYPDGRKIKLKRGAECFETAGFNSTKVRDISAVKWNISGLEDGEYILRLSVEDMLGNKSNIGRKFIKEKKIEDFNVILDSAGLIKDWLNLSGKVKGSSEGRYRVEYKKEAESNWNNLMSGFYACDENQFLKMDTRGSSSWPLMSRIDGLAGRFLVKNGRVISRDNEDGIEKVYNAQGGFLFGFGENKNKCKPGENGEGDVNGYGQSFGPDGIYVVSNKFNNIQIFSEDGQYKGEINSLNFSPHDIFLDDWEKVINWYGAGVEVYNPNDKSVKKIVDWWDDNIHPTDMGIDAEGRIYILDSVTNKVKIYGSGGGLLEEEISLEQGFSAGHLTVLEDGSLVVGSAFGSYSIYYNNDGKFKSYINPGDWVRIDENGWLYSEENGGIGIYGPNLGGLKLEDGKYDFRVVCEDGKGGIAIGKTNLEVDNTAPDAVYPIAFTWDSTGRITLDWNEYIEALKRLSVDADDVERYEIYQSTQIYTSVEEMIPIGTVEAFNALTHERINAFTTTVQNIRDTMYYFSIVAVDKAGNKNSQVITTGIGTVDLTPPNAVGNFKAVPHSGRVELSWINPPDVDFCGVKIIEEHGAEGMEQKEIIYTGMATSFTDTAVTNGVTYTFTIQSYDEVPNYSRPVSVQATPKEWENSQLLIANAQLSMVKDAAIFDYNNDNKLDLFLIGDKNVLLTSAFNQEPVTMNWDNDGQCVYVLDYDGDKDLDIFVGTDSASVIYKNCRGESMYSPNEWEKITGPGFGVKKMIARDFDRDHDLDLFIIGVDPCVRPYLNDGNGNFMESTVLEDGNSVNDLASFDYDKDNGIDLVLAGEKVWLYKNKTPLHPPYQGDNWELIPGPWDADTTVVSTIALADYNNDSNIDIFAGTNQGIKLYENSGKGNFIEATESFTSQPLGAFKQIEFLDYDNDGDLDLYVVTSLSNIFYENQQLVAGDFAACNFIDRTDDFSLASNEGTQKALMADYDKDGDRDIILFNKESNKIINNNCNNKNYIEAVLRGQEQGGNYFGIGNEVQLTNKLTGAGQRQVVKDSLPVHFGKGEDSQQ